MILCVLLSYLVVLICTEDNIHKCSEYHNNDTNIITNLSKNGSKPTTVIQTCNYEILAPLGQQVEVVFDVTFHSPVHCVPSSKPSGGIFISYTHYDNVTYYDVICNNKSSYLVRSVGRRLYLKFVMNGVSFSFRGSFHYVQRSDCIYYTCLNGGTCLTTNGKRFCICPPGLIGYTCSACSSFICYNGGSCVMSMDQKPSCACDIHFEGAHCEKSRNPCISNPCLFGHCNIMTSVSTERSNNFLVPTVSSVTQGIITTFKLYDKINSISQERRMDAWRCACYPGYTGVQCEHNINECDSNPCLQGQDCIDGVNQYECSCNHCVFGLCVVDGGSIMCRCFPGFTGDNCSRNVNECDFNPCIHGDCVDFINGYVCSCYENYSGRNCDVSIRRKFNESNNANSSICFEHFCGDGVCIERESVPFCQCSMGFSGTRCDVPLSFLVPNNLTLSSQKHECFLKKDFENTCSCISTLCRRSRNSSACDAVMILSSLKALCTVENDNSLCLSYYDSNIVFILQNLCIQEQNGTTLSKPAGNANITTSVPEHWNSRLIFSYIFQCELSNRDERIRIELFPDGYTVEHSQSLYLYSECDMDLSDKLIVPNCSLSSLAIHFNFSKSPIYLKSVSFKIIDVESYNSSNTPQYSIVSDENFKQTMRISMRSEMESLDNTTVLLNSSYNGEASYRCDRLCDDIYCRQRYCEKESTKNLMDNESISEKEMHCHCPDNIKTERICNITKNIDITGFEDKRSYLAFYIVAAVSVFFIFVIPGSAFLYIKRSKQRGEATFPNLICTPSKVWPIHSTLTLPNESENAIDLRKLTTMKGTVAEKKNRVIKLEGVETGKSEV